MTTGDPPPPSWVNWKWGDPIRPRFEESQGMCPSVVALEAKVALDKVQRLEHLVLEAFDRIEVLEKRFHGEHK